MLHYPLVNFETFLSMYSQNETFSPFFNVNKILTVYFYLLLTLVDVKKKYLENAERFLYPRSGTEGTSVRGLSTCPN